MNEPALIPDTSKPNVYGPLTARELLDRTFRLLSDSPRLFFGIVLVVVAVEIVVAVVLGFGGFSMRHIGASGHPVARALFLLPLSLIGAALIFVFTQIAQGALFLATQAKLSNSPVTAGGACSLAAAKAGRLIAVSLLVALRVLGYLFLLFVAFFAVLLVVGLVSGISSGYSGHMPVHFGHMPSLGFQMAALGLVLLLFLVYFFVLLWLAARYALSIPACLAENLGALDAIRRSIRLSTGSRGRIYAVFVLVGCVSIAVLMLTLPLQLIFMHLAHAGQRFSAGPWGVIAILMAGFRFAVGALLIAFTGVATALCYFDLRVRKEGFGNVPPPTVREPMAFGPPAVEPPPVAPPSIEPPSLENTSVQDLPPEPLP